MFGREAIKMKKRAFQTVVMVLSTVPQPQPARPYTGANTKELQNRGAVMRKPEAPPNFTLPCLCLPSPHLPPH